MQQTLFEILRRVRRPLTGGHPVASVAPTRRIQPRSLLCVQALVAGTASTLLSLMPGTSNSVGFAQEQPRVNVRSSQAQPALNDLLRVPGTWLTGSFKLFSGATLTFGFQDDGYHWMFDGAGDDFLDSRAFEAGFVGADYVDPLVGGSASNVILELDARKSSGGDDNAFGLGCRQTADAGYLLWAGTDGSAGIDRIGPVLGDVSDASERSSTPSEHLSLAVATGGRGFGSTWFSSVLC